MSLALSFSRFFIFFVFCLVAITRNTSASEDPKPLFQNNDILTISITLPMRPILSRNMGETDDVSGSLELTGDDGASIIFDIKAELRGISRQKKEQCRFPPLRLNFQKGQVKETLFDGQNKLKLVTYCKDNDRYEQFYLKEYLGYRFYNQITDISFRAKLAHITYIDSDDPDDTVTRYGFLIEDVDDVAQRNGMQEINVERVPVRELEKETAALNSMFQYLIGNLDWAIMVGPPGENCCHNGKLLQMDGPDGPSGAYYSIPYDFDASGLVDASYAVVPPGIRARSVRQRVYRGFCSLNEFVPMAVERFMAEKAALYDIVSSFDLLDSRSKRDTIRYLDDFYETIENPEELKDNILDECLG